MDGSAAAASTRRTGHCAAAAHGDGDTAGGMHVVPGTSGVNVKYTSQLHYKIVKHAGR